MLYAFRLDFVGYVFPLAKPTKPSFARTDICVSPLDVARLVGWMSCDRLLHCCTPGCGCRTVGDVEIST